MGRSCVVKRSNSWPGQPIIESNEESGMERKRVEETLAVTFTSETIHGKLLVKYSILKTLRI